MTKKPRLKASFLYYLKSLLSDHLSFANIRRAKSVAAQSRFPCTEQDGKASSSPSNGHSLLGQFLLSSHFSQRLGVHMVGEFVLLLQEVQPQTVCLQLLTDDFEGGKEIPHEENEVDNAESKDLPFLVV